MIVVIGSPTIQRAAGRVTPAGAATGIAQAIVRRGGSVQLIGRVADDPDGDAVLRALEAAGVGHVATLRGPAGTAAALDGADVDLGLRYLADLGVLVLVDGQDDGLRSAAIDAAAWSGAALVVLHPRGAVPLDLPADATLLEAPDADLDDAFATVVAGHAVALDRGEGIRPARAGPPPSDARVVR